MHYLKYKDIILKPHDGRVFGRGMGAKGEFRFVLRDAKTDRVIQDTDWFDNLFLDEGIMNVGYPNWCSYIGIGDSAVPPTVLDLQLGNELALAGASLYAEQNGGSPDYEIITTMKGRFGDGVGDGTIREVGVRKSSTYYGGSLNYSFRTLLPAPVVKSSGQVLDVFWRLTVFPDLTTDSGTFDWGGELYNYRTAPGLMQAGNNLTWTTWGNPGFNWLRTTGASIDTGIEARPSGGSAWFNGTSHETLIHVPGQRRLRWHIPLQGQDWNIQAIQFDMTTTRTSQYDQGLKVLFERASDNAPLTLLNTEIAYFDMEWTWGRLP
jgi:hypothetical protein